MKKISLPFLSVIALAACGIEAPPGDELGETQQASQSELRPSGRGHNPKGFAGGKARTNNVTLHGGPVMLGTNHIYYIWYGNWTTATNNVVPGILTDFANNLGGSPYWNINTTYYNSANTYLSNSLTYAGMYDYTPTHAGYSTSLSDANIQTIVSSTITGGHLPSDPSGIYFVLTSSDVTASSGFCTQYCGWHTHATVGGADIKYSFVGDPTRCPTSCQQQTTGPNGSSGADGMASIIAHEAEEAATDPDLNAWYDRTGYENADKCAWTFGTMCTAANGAKYNMALGARRYLIQRNWTAGATQGCFKYLGAAPADCGAQ